MTRPLTDRRAKGAWIMHWSVDVLMVLLCVGMGLCMLLVAKGLFG